MGRPPRPPGGGKYKDIWFTTRQLEIIEALRATATYGKPSFQAVIEEAIESFLGKPEVREKVAQYQAEDPRVVPLRDVSRPNGGKS